MIGTTLSHFHILSLIGEADRITHLSGGHVLDLDGSKDGERLLLWRGEATTDVVLITGFE